jgi:hypothetical protein
MATIRTVAEARILSIQRVQTLNRLFTEMNKIRVLVASAVAQLPAGDAAKVIARVQSEIEPLVDRAAAAIGTHSAPKGDSLFMNYRPLLSIVMAPKGSGTVDLRDHWISNQGGATLRAPDEDFVERYIASQNAIVSAIELHRLGALRQLDARWELPSDTRCHSGRHQPPRRMLPFRLAGGAGERASALSQDESAHSRRHLRSEQSHSDLPHLFRRPTR